MHKNKNFILNKSYVTIDEISKLRKAHNMVSCYATSVTGAPFIVTDNIAIFVMEGLSHSIRIYTANNIPENSYFFFTVPHLPFSEKSLADQINLFMDVTKGKFSLDSLVMMANTDSDVKIAHRLGLKRSFFCNQNCWLDYGVYKITRGLNNKPWNLVLNTRPEYEFKRPWLAQKVENIGIVQGKLHRKDDYWDLNQLKPKYMNPNRIPNTDVNNLLNRAYVGGIFSASEGACYSSSEYLLAGLPVISTPSIGGRDYWYTDDNHLIVEPTVEAVAKGVDILKKRLINGDINQASIRMEHIQESNRLRDIFISKVEELLSKYKSELDVTSIFNAYFTDKFIRTSKYPYDHKP